MPEVLKIVLDSAQHQGMRSEQQDAICALGGDSRMACDAFAIVADGMGGMLCGKEASEIATSSFVLSFGKNMREEAIEEALLHALHDANDAVKSRAEENACSGEMGTTLIAAAAREDRLYWISAGDSRIYLFCGGGLRQLNVEHNLRNRLLRLAKEGLIDGETIDSDPQAEALTSFVGIEELKEIDTPDTPVKLEIGDKVLLCSDGLYKTLSDDEICNAVSSYGGDNLAEYLVELTIEKGRRHQDNVSVVVLRCVADPAIRTGGSQETKNDLTATTVLMHRGGKTPRAELIRKNKRSWGYLAAVLLIVTVLGVVWRFQI